MPKSVTHLVALLFLLFVVGPASADGVRMDAKPAFDGLLAGGPYPIIVTLSNTGAPVDGEISVSGGQYTISHIYTYPVSLPTNSLKKVTIYPNIYGGSDATITYEGHSVELPIVNGAYGANRQIGLIADMPSGFETIHPDLSAGYTVNTSGQPSMLTACSTTPDNAPDRPAGYEQLAVVALADGAERLTSAQWKALRGYVLSGGVLFVTGGASAAYLASPDLQPMLPVSNIEHATIGSLGDAVENGPHSAASIAIGNLKKGAVSATPYNGKALVARWSYGLGRVVFVGYSIQDKPIHGWAGQDTLIKSLITNNEFSTQHLEETNGPRDYSGTGSSYSGTLTSDVENDPFSARLPPLKIIGAIFALYALLALPVSFLVLRAVRRLEWAWVATPVLSLAFAAVFAAYTINMYKANLSRRTMGTAVAVEGSGEFRFAGYSDIFFPREGQYNVTSTNADSLELGTDRMDEGTGGVLATVDNGAVAAPNYQADNLSFRRLYTWQMLDINGSISLRENKAGGLTDAVVVNNTSMPLTNVELCETTTMQTYSVGDIGPNSSGKVNITSVAPDQTIYQMVQGHDSTIFISANTSGAGFGTDIGRDVSPKDSVHLIVSVPH